MLITEQESRHLAIMAAAQQMLTAARTAPKGCGRDTLALVAVYGDTLLAIADKMDEIGNDAGLAFFLRDAKNVRQSQGMILIGGIISPLGMHNCGLCGMETCDNKNKYQNIPCAFNSVDIGIAVGSAAAVAAQLFVDTRVMFSAGKAAIALGLPDKYTKIAFGMPLSCSSKNPFFDRQC